MKKNTKRTQASPHQKATQHQVFALFDAAMAAARLPELRWLVAIAAKTMETIPKGWQQKIVTRMAWTR